MIFADAPIPSRKAKIRQNITQSDEMRASHHGRKRGLAKQWVMMTQISKGLNQAKNHGSKYGYQKTIRLAH